jgi:hypothetical protein
MKFAGFLLKGNCLSSVSYFVRSSFPWNSIWKVKAPLKILITFFFIVRLQENCGQHAFQVVWCCMGYTSKGERVIGELEGTIGKPYFFENVEVGSFVCNVVSLERPKCEEL